MDKYLSKIYYDIRHPASYSGVDRLWSWCVRQGKKKYTREKVARWLDKQDTYTLHKPVRRKFARNRVLVGGIDEQWQADLVDLASLKKENDGITFLLTCIDILSKKAWVRPLKDKRGSNVTREFGKILAEGRVPWKLQTDAGKEFLNREFQSLLEKHDIHFFTTNNETKASVVERFNRTLKTKMYRYFTRRQMRRYMDVLEDLVSGYNHTVHGSTGMRPVDVNKKNQAKVWRTLYGRPRPPVGISRRYKYRVGQRVRLSKVKKKFEKGYLPNWTEEIFVVVRRHPRKPPVYTVKDLDGEVLEGTFYAEELQPVQKTNRSVFRIEKILGERRYKNKTQVLIKWAGYPAKFNSYIDKRSLRKYRG